MEQSRCCQGVRDGIKPSPTRERKVVEEGKWRLAAVSYAVREFGIFGI